MDNKRNADNVGELKSRADKEPVAAFFGMKLVELTPGHSRVSMKIRPEYVNFNGLLFGGIVVSVADMAFAYATNSLIRPSYASQLNVHFVAAAEVGDELTAECRVLKSGRRVGISEITVTNQKGDLIAKLTGTTIPVV